MGMPASLSANSTQELYLDPLPFDNLNVQELWSWMGDLDGYDSYSWIVPSSDEFVGTARR